MQDGIIGAGDCSFLQEMMNSVLETFAPRQERR